MYGKIKELAAAAVMLQNKGAMDEALRRIVHIAHEAESAPQAGDTVRVTGISDGEGNEQALSVKVTSKNEAATAAFNKAENEALVLAKLRAELASEDPQMADAAALVLKHLPTKKGGAK